MCSAAAAAACASRSKALKDCSPPSFRRVSLKLKLLVLCVMAILTMLLFLCIESPRSRNEVPTEISTALQHRPPLRTHDILRYTALDPGEAEERSKIRQLLEGDERRLRHSWQEARLATRMQHEMDRSLDPYERSSSTRSSFYTRKIRSRWPPGLLNPRFLPYLGQFRELLQGWARMKRYDPLVMNELLPTLKPLIDKHLESSSSAGGAAVENSTLRYTSNINTGNTMENINNNVINNINNNINTGNVNTMKNINNNINVLNGTRKYKTCAVVGNSGMLLNQSYAADIDSHEMVMRLNNARVNGFESKVGRKTSISFVNSNILHACARRPRCACQPYAQPVAIVSYICQVAHFMDVAYCRASHAAPLLVTDPRLDSLCTRIARYYSLTGFFQATGQGYEEWSKIHDGAFFHYSSGMQAVVLALGLCDQVDAYGFGKPAGSRHHYHTRQQSELALHDYEAEYRFYHDLAAGAWRSIPFLNATLLDHVSSSSSSDNSAPPLPRLRLFL